MQNKKCWKKDVLTFFNILGDYFISHEKIGHVLQKQDVALVNNATHMRVALLNNATHMRPVQIWVRQTQNLTVTSRDVS